MVDSPYTPVAQTLLAIPQNYRNPNDLSSSREYAKALMQGSLQQPVHHWTQGVSNVVSALMGGLLDNKVNSQENEANAVRAGRMLPTVGTAPAPATPTTPSFSEGPTSGGTQNADASEPRGIRNNNPLNIEAGTFTQSQPGFVGSDGRFARFETPEHGIAAANKLLDSYEQRGLNTVAGIVGRWAPATDGNNVSAYAKDVASRLGIDPNAPIPPEMRPQLIAAMGQHENGKPIQMAGTPAPSTAPSAAPEAAMAFAGPDAQSPAVNAMGAALRGEPAGTQVAAGKSPVPPTQPMVMPNGAQGPLINPALVQRRPQYNEGQMRGILADPTISEQTKMQLLQAYQQQDQPIQMPYPGGTVLIDPRNPQRQQFIPDLHWGKKTLPGGLGYDVPQAVVPGANGGIQQAPITPPAAAVGPQSSAAPPSAPTAAPQAAPAPSAGPVQAGQPAPIPTPAVASQAPVQVASLDPAAGVKPVPPVAPQVAAAEAGPTMQNAAAQTVANPGVVGPLAQALGTTSKPPPGYSQEDWDATRGYKNLETKTEVDKDAALKSTDLASKKYDTLSTQAQNARGLRNNVELALGMLNDPNMHQGLFSGAQDLWSRFKVAALGDTYANAPNETFDKLMAGNVLGTMKTALGGLGQVRLAEIQLLNKANGNRYNTDASNRAVLEISRRGLEKVDQIDGMSQQYMSGDEVTDPISGKTILKANVGPDGEIAPRHGLDVGFDRIVRKWTNDNPSFTPEQIAEYGKIFDTGKSSADSNWGKTPKAEGGAPATPAPAAGSFPTPPAGAINDLKANPGAAAQFDQIFGAGAAAKALGTK